MATDTIIMVVLICVGCALVLAGLGYAGYHGWRMVKASRQVGDVSKNRVQQITGRAERMAPRLRDLEAKQKAVTESIERLSTTARKSDSD